MRITFLGGADEIGASAALVEVNDLRLLIDCGQRLNAPVGQTLPDFSQLDDEPLDAVLITHAHADHIGALPALVPFLTPHCPIYATEPTIALTKVMLEDSVRIMVQHRQGEGQLPMFPISSVANAVARMKPVHWGTKLPLGKGDVFATWIPSGHILGAAMIEIRDSEQSILFSGDLSVSEQLSVPGAFTPATQPDILVIESTYGSRQHAHRPTQEQRVVDRVLECIESGGHVLFPTFALGRAQEVLLILGRAMREGALPKIPIFADGLVRAISKVYFRHPEELSPYCRKLWEMGLHPLFPDDLPIRGIQNDRHREKIAAGESCVVVASSGMLQGGASHFYAMKWMDDPRNLILITGYQDEESPGQALLNLASQQSTAPRTFVMGGIKQEVRCQVESFHLSAHADQGELLSIVAKLGPKLVLPVHGEESARLSFAKAVEASVKTEVLLPYNGGTYSAFGDPRRVPSTRVPRPNPLAMWPPWDPNKTRGLDLEMFHRWLASVTPKIGWITIDELAEIWKSPKPVSKADRETVRKAVFESRQEFFVPDSKRRHVLKITPMENLASEPTREHRAPVEVTTAVLQELFPRTTGLKRYGFYPSEEKVQLEFEFPRAARRRFLHQLAELEERTGWNAEIKDDPSSALAIQLARDWLELLPTELIHISEDEQSLEVTTNIDMSSDHLEELAERFEHKTGYRLQISPVAMESNKKNE